MLVECLKPLNVLVTNVVWYPVKRKKDIPKHEWGFGEKALQELYDYVQPKVVFCHGKDAERFARLLNPNVYRNQPAEEQIQDIDNEVMVIAYHHFSGQGLKKGWKFNTKQDLPVFAKGMRSYVSLRTKSIP
jgi:hypothetical protein